MNYTNTLMPQQQAVLDLLLDPQKYDEIPRILGIEPGTVKRHVARIADKWGIDDSRFHLRVRIVYLEAIRRGLIRAIPN